MEFMKLFGVAGLLLIIAGIIVQDRKRRNYLFIAGGVLLEAYSIAIGDLIFIILQAVFTMAAVYDLLKQSHRLKARVTILLLGLAGILVIGIVWTVVSQQYSLESRLVLSVRKHVPEKDIFTADNLIDKSESYVGFQGDGGMNGVFQLSETEMEQLLFHDAPLICPAYEVCEVKDNDSTKNHISKIAYLDGQDVIYRLYLDLEKNLAEWSVSWY